MECLWNGPFHMDSIVCVLNENIARCQPKNSQMESMEWVGIHPFHMKSGRECKDLYTLLLLPNHHNIPIFLIILYHTLKYSHGIK